LPLLPSERLSRRPFIVALIVGTISNLIDRGDTARRIGFLPEIGFNNGPVGDEYVPLN
jgi:hypothetical protein